MRNSMMIFFFFLFWARNNLFGKIRHNDQSYYKFLFKLFNLMMLSFSFRKLVKILENVSALQSFFLIKNIKLDSTLIQYPNETSLHWTLLCYLSNPRAFYSQIYKASGFLLQILWTVTTEIVTHNDRLNDVIPMPLIKNNRSRIDHCKVF